MAFTLVHSPLVGPATWQPVAAELRRRGVEVAVPCLVEPASRGDWHGCVDAAAGGALPGSTLVAHSGAGPLLPVIASRLASPAVRLVFVDAGVPPALGHASLASPEFLAHLRTLAIDGRLPKWSEWFGDGAMDGLVPDPASRAAIVDELPELPLSYFESRVPMPAGWTNMPAMYVRLSAPYRGDAVAARANGWPVVELPGAHLDIVTRPAEIAEVLVA